MKEENHELLFESWNETIEELLSNNLMKREGWPASRTLKLKNRSRARQNLTSDFIDDRMNFCIVLTIVSKYYLNWVLMTFEEFISKWIKSAYSAQKPETIFKDVFKWTVMLKSNWIILTLLKVIFFEYLVNWKVQVLL